jgi:hypothetical protein
MKPGEADGSRRGVACSELQSCRLASGANQVRLAPGVSLARLPRSHEALLFASVAGPVGLVHRSIAPEDESVDGHSTSGGLIPSRIPFE